MIPFYLLLLSFICSPLIATAEHDVVYEQVTAEQAMVSAFLDTLTAMFKRDSQSLLKKTYPLGHVAKNHPARMSFPSRFIDNIFAVSRGGILQVVVRFNAKPYTTPLLKNAQIVMTAYHQGIPIKYNSIYQVNARTITDWRCETKSPSSYVLNQGPFVQCGVEYY